MYTSTNNHDVPGVHYKILNTDKAIYILVINDTGYQLQFKFKL